MNTTLQHKPLLVALSLAGFPGPFITHDGNSVVTAFSIIEQMPVGSSIQTIAEGTGWICRLKIDALNYVVEQDVCPHKAAAKAYIAWKNGLQ